MTKTGRLKLTIVSLFGAAILTGCGGGGASGLLGLFGGGDGVGGESFASLFSDGELPDFLTGDAPDLGGGDSGLTPPLGVVYNPEPTSLALFGGGLGALALRRRRKQARQTPPISS